jgi:histone acetyltransferase 1
MCLGVQHFEFYPPLFAHQIFGDDECIHGYMSPEIDITYSEDSLLPALTFTHIPLRNPDNSPAAIPPGATDVLAAIQQNAPADYFAPDQLPASKKRFEPRGQLLGDYTGHELRRGKQLVSAMESERGGHVRFQLFRANAGPDIGSQRVLLQRAQSLAMWMIEACSYIDLDDPNWSCIMLYEKTIPWANPSPSRSQSPRTKQKDKGGPKYRLVGFVTLFRCPLGMDLTQQELRDMSARADQVWEHRHQMVRLNVSQLLVLPTFQGQGHAKQLLRAVYKEAQRDDSVLDVRVEEPTDIFNALRLSVELDMLEEHHLLQELRSATPPWQHMQVAL